MAVKAPVKNEFGVEVGDFFESSWGYDQTNVDFYKVVGVTAKGVKVQKWSSAHVGNDGPHDSVVPGEKVATWVDWSAVSQDDDYWTRQEKKVVRDAPVEFHRLRAGYSGAAFTVNSYSAAYKWDGTPQYQTGQGYGH